MQRNKRAMRRAVLARMFDLLEESYGVDISREEFVGEMISPHEVDALLSFKSDTRLVELRGALERINDGSFGICIGCKTEIELELLQREPARRMCARCEREFSRVTEDAESHALHP